MLFQIYIKRKVNRTIYLWEEETVPGISFFWLMIENNSSESSMTIIPVCYNDETLFLLLR